MARDKVERYKNGWYMCCYKCQMTETGKRKLLMCARCESITYCGRKCQKEDWDRHRQFCEELRRREYNADDNNSGYRAGPIKKAKKDEQEEENRRLKLENQNLRAMLAEYQDKHRKCVREHGIMDVKKEEPLDSASSSSSVKVKAEPCVKREQEHKEYDENICDTK